MGAASQGAADVGRRQFAYFMLVAGAAALSASPRGALAQVRRLVRNVASLRRLRGPRGALVTTLGFDQPGDGGQATYLLQDGAAPVRPGFDWHTAGGYLAIMQTTGVVPLRALGFQPGEDNTARFDALPPDHHYWVDENYQARHPPRFDLLRGPGGVSLAGVTLPVGDIASPLELRVPEQFDSLRGALEYLAPRRILAPHVTLRLAAGVFRERSMEAGHVDGSRIRVVGSGSDRTTLVFRECHGIVAMDGYSWGLWDRLTIDGDGRAGRRFSAVDDFQGVMAKDGGAIRLGSDVTVQDFSRVGVMAFRGSRVFANGVRVRRCGSDGFVCSHGSTLHANHAVSEENEGDGLFCEWEATAHFRNSTCSNNAVRDPDGTAGDRGGGHGITARYGGNVFATGAYLPRNAAGALVATHGAYVNVDGARVVDHPAATLPTVVANVGSTVSGSQIHVSAACVHAVALDDNSTARMVGARLICRADAPAAVLASNGSVGRFDASVVIGARRAFVARRGSRITAIGVATSGSGQPFVVDAGGEIDSDRSADSEPRNQRTPVGPAALSTRR